MGSNEPGRNECEVIYNAFHILNCRCGINGGPQGTCCKLKSCCKLKECFCKLKHEKYARALKEEGVAIRIFIVLSGKLLYVFLLGLCDYSNKFRKKFCSSCGRECPSTANFCHQCGQMK